MGEKVSQDQIEGLSEQLQALENKKIISIGFTGTTTKTLTIQFNDGSVMSGVFSDINTTYPALTLLLLNDGTSTVDSTISAKILTDYLTANHFTQAQINALLGNYVHVSQKGVANGVATLDGGGKIPVSQLPNSVMELQGKWNAETNTPTLADGTGNPGDVYEVIKAGTQNLGSGNLTFKVGDWAVYGADGKWYVSLNSNEVTSVNGMTGSVVLNKSHIGLSNVDNTSDATKNVLSATKWTTPRTFTIGNVAKSVDGTGNITWSNSELIAGLDLVDKTTDDQEISGRKIFFTVGNDTGSYLYNTLWIRGLLGNKPAITFYRNGIDSAQIAFTGFVYQFLNNNSSSYVPILASSFIKDGSDNTKVLLGGGSDKLISDFALSSSLGNYVPQVGDYNIYNLKSFLGAYTQWILDGDSVNNARGFVQSLPGGFLTGTLNDKNFVIYRNNQEKIVVEDLKTTFNQSIQAGNYVASLDMALGNKVDTLRINRQAANVMGILSESNGWAYCMTAGYKRSGSDDTYVLTGGGGHKAISDFALSSQLGNYLPLTGGTLTGEGRIEPTGTIYVQQSDTFQNATGLFWEDISNSDKIAGIGTLTQDGDLVHTYMGWGPAPWNGPTNLSVGPTKFTYKNYDIWHSGNLKPISIDSDGAINNGSDTRTNKIWFDYNWANTSLKGSVINFSGLGGNYSTELFASYDNPNYIGIRSRDGDANSWNPVKYLFHSGNFNPASKTNSLENATGIGFSSGVFPTDNGAEYPYFYYNNGSSAFIVPMATQAFVNYKFGSYVPYTGATSNLDLNSKSLITSGAIYAGVLNALEFYSSVLSGNLILNANNANILGVGNTSLPTIRYDSSSNHLFRVGGSYIAEITGSGMGVTGNIWVNNSQVLVESQKGVANGVAPLGVDSKISSAYLPSYVDDVLEFANLASFPVTGESGKIYVAVDTNLTYRWGGSSYTQIAAGAVQSVNGQTGVVNLSKSHVGLGNVDNTSDANKNVLSATKWTMPRTLSYSGDVIGSASVDGSGNVNFAMSLPVTGVAAGSYNNVNVDAKGRVTGGSFEPYVKDDSTFRLLEKLWVIDHTPTSLDSSEVKQWNIIFNASLDGEVDLNLFDGQYYQFSNISGGVVKLNVVVQLAGSPATVDSIDPGITKKYLSYGGGKLLLISETNNTQIV